MSSPIQGSLAKDRLGIPSVVFFVMSAAAPLTVVAGVVTTGYGNTQVLGIPFGFITIAVILGVFSVGYVAMSRHITNAGAFYTYVSNGLGRPLGVGAAWMAVLAYNALQVGLYGIIGSAVAPLLKQWFNIDANWVVIALVAWAIVLALGLMRVDINSKVLALLLCAEIVLPRYRCSGSPEWDRISRCTPTARRRYSLRALRRRCTDFSVKSMR